MNIKVQTLCELTADISEVSFFSNGRNILVCSEKTDEGNVLHCFDSESREIVNQLKSNLDLILSCVAFEETRRLVYLGRDEMGSFVIDVLDIDTFELLNSTGLPNNPFYYSLSRNPKRHDIVYLIGNQVEMFDLNNGELKTLVSSYEENEPLCFVMGNEDNAYCFGSKEGEILNYDVSDFSVKGALSAPGDRGSHLFLSPSGDTLIAVSRSSKGVYVYNLISGERILENLINENTGRAIFATIQNEEWILRIGRAGFFYFDKVENTFSENLGLRSGHIRSVSSNVNGNECLIAQSNGVVTSVTVK